ncbi:hypothetical protein LUZ60_010190 [Juncus effusus]|nr:hypothetical protein LUZ60_010190 [Juncus effusus]
MESGASSNATPTFHASPFGSIEKSVSQNEQNEESTQNEESASENEEELAFGSKKALTSPAWNQFKRPKTKEPYYFDEEVVRKEIASMIISHEYPLNMVEHVGFQRFVGAVQPFFKPISLNTVRSDVMEIYEHERVKTMELLENNESRVAITTNMWKSSDKYKTFMAVTAHFVDESWVLQSRLIRFIYVPYPQTDEVLCDALLNCLMDWNLDSKLSTITLDNCFMNGELMDLVSNKLSSGSFLLNGEVLHIRCCANILNSIVTDCLEVINGAIEKIRDSVAFWIATPKRYEKFEETICELKISSTEKLVLDCEANWISTFLMLNVAIPYKDVFKCLKERKPLYECELSEEEWEMATQICDMLEVFYNITGIFSENKYSSTDLYFPMMIEIKTALKKWNICGKPFIENISGKMTEKFDKYWDKIHGIMGVAIVLDPRYKLKLFEYYFPLLYGDDVAKLEIEKIRKLCYDLFPEYASKLKVKKEERRKNNPSQLSRKKSDFIIKFDEFVASQRNNKFKSELDFYLEATMFPITSDFDLLSWWKNAFNYPALQLIARDILAIRASTIDSESAFNMSGRFVNPHYDGLCPHMIEALMCTKNWLSYVMEDSSLMDNYEDDAFDNDAEEDDEV